MICQDCKYFLYIKGGYCGLGYSCEEAIKQNSCSQKIEGEIELAEIIAVTKWNYFNDFRIEQAPSFLRELNELVYFHRSHRSKRNDSYRQVNIKFGLKGEAKEKNSYQRDRERLIKLFHPKAKEVSAVIEDRVLEIHITWRENKRECFRAKKARKHREIE